MSKYHRAHTKISGITKSAGLIALLVFVLLATTFCSPRPNVDFPCEWYGSGLPVERDATTRIIYCISLYPADASGGMIYKSGASSENQVTIALPGAWHRNLTLERRGDTLVVNNQELQPNETYTQTLTSSIASWGPATPMLQVTNDTMYKRLNLADAIYALGAIKE